MLHLRLLLLALGIQERGHVRHTRAVVLAVDAQVLLGTKSNISRIRTALLARELIDVNKDGIFLEDPVFKLWMQTRLS